MLCRIPVNVLISSPRLGSYTLVGGLRELINDFKAHFEVLCILPTPPSLLLPVITSLLKAAVT